MAYFKELNGAVNKIIEIIISDQELCKLLYYSEDDPLNQPIISNTKTLIFDKIFPFPKQPDAQLEKGSLINIYFLSGKPWSGNNGFKKEMIAIDVLCHLDSWKIIGGIRPYEISERLDTLFNNKNIKEISSNKVYFDGWTNIKYSDYFYGYRLIYILTNDSNVGT
jgi:hypothetical protein